MLRRVNSVRISDSKGFVKVWSQCRELCATMVGMGLKWAFSVRGREGCIQGWPVGSAGIRVYTVQSVMVRAGKGCSQGWSMLHGQVCNLRGQR
jgi:hypothetical protein